MRSDKMNFVSTSKSLKTAQNNPDGSVGTKEIHDRMNAYVYDLLSEEESQKIEQEVQDSRTLREALNNAKQLKEKMDSWEEVQPPQGLAQRTMQFILQKEKDLQTT